MSRKELWILFLIFLATVFLRFYQLSATPPGLYPDEAMNGNNALEALQTGQWKIFYPENNGREGLFMNVQALLLAAIGQNEPWVLRLPSATFGVLTVCGFFLLLYELALVSKIERRFGLAAFGAFFMATSFWHINFSRIGFRAIMAPFFIVWAIYFILLAFRKRWFRAAFLAGAALGLGMYSYIAYRVMPLLLLLFIRPFRHKREFWHIAFGVAAVAFIVFLPIGLYFISHPADFMGRTSQVSVFSSPTPASDLLKNIGLTLAMFNFRGDGNWRHNIAGAPEVFWPVGVFLLVGLIIAIRSRTLFDWMMLFWLFLAFLPVVISNEGIPHALRSILMIPPVFGLAARGAVWLYEFLDHRIRSRELLRGLIIVSAILLFLEAYNAYFVVWAKNQNVRNAFAANYVDIGREINSLPVNSPKYVVVRSGGVDVRGIPMPAQTVMFITDSFLPEDRMAKNIFYFTDADYAKLAPLSPGAHVFFID